MPRTSIPVTKITRNGVLDIDATGLRVLSSAANDHKFVNDGHTFLYVKNADIATRTVVIPAQDGLSDDISVDLLAGDHVLIGPIVRGKYNVPFTGDCYVNVAVDTVLSLAAFRF